MRPRGNEVGRSLLIHEGHNGGGANIVELAEKGMKNRTGRIGEADERGVLSLVVVSCACG